MKPLVTLCLSICLLAQVAIGQSEIASSNNHFVHEKIGTKLNHIYLDKGDMKIYFHKDRIEIINENGESSYFFMMFDNKSFQFPEGEGLVNKENVLIQDDAMKYVLEEDYMEKSYFKSIIYKDISTGKELFVSVKNNQLMFNSISNMNMDFLLWGNTGETSNRSAKVQLEEFGKLIEISSKDFNVIKEENNISFKQNGSEENANLQFSISIN